MAKPTHHNYFKSLSNEQIGSYKRVNPSQFIGKHSAIERFQMPRAKRNTRVVLQEKQAKQQNLGINLGKLLLLFHNGDLWGL